MSAEIEAVAFTRLVDIPFEQCVAALETWWLIEGTGPGQKGGAQSHLVGDLERPLGTGGCRIGVRLARRAPWPGSLMELEVWPWSSSRGLTLLELVPRRTVNPSRRYFQAGHAFLDMLIEALRLHASEYEPLAKAM